MMTPVFLAAIGLASGLVLGLIHFGTLWTVTTLHLEGARARAIGLQILRLVLLAVLMVVLAGFGVAALLAGMLGVILAREIVLRRARKEG